MRTPARNSEEANFGRAILMVALAVVLGSTGCQKEDVLMPSNSSAVTQVDARTQPTIDESATNFDNGNLDAINNFNLIKIDHQSGKSQLPDYSVVVRSDGWVIYDGHRNVRIKDRVIFRISDVTLPILNEIFKQYDFNRIVSDFVIYPDMPVVYTTYQPTQFIRPRTIYDDCYNNPQRLVLIRTSVEKLLGIEKYVNMNWKNVPSEVQDPLF